jgi:hypothetical protein
MARLLKKMPNNLKYLQTAWTNRDEFVACVLADPEFLPLVKPALPNRDDFLVSKNDWVRHMFMPSGWQLSTFGCAILMRAYQSWRIVGPTKDNLTGKLVVNMNKMFNGPWYCNTTALYVWDQKLHCELQMFNGDLNLYINAYLPA